MRTWPVLLASCCPALAQAAQHFAKSYVYRVFMCWSGHGVRSLTDFVRDFETISTDRIRSMHNGLPENKSKHNISSCLVLPLFPYAYHLHLARFRRRSITSRTYQVASCQLLRNGKEQLADDVRQVSEKG